MKDKLKEFVKDYGPLIPILVIGLAFFLGVAKLCDLFM